jgi:hypothetical protein
MAPATFHRFDKEVLLKMLSDLALSPKNKRTAAEAEQSGKKDQVESAPQEQCPSETQK